MRSLRRSLVMLAAGLALGAPAADAATRVVGVAGPANDRDVTRLGGWVVRTQAQSTLARATRRWAGRRAARPARRAWRRRRGARSGCAARSTRSTRRRAARPAARRDGSTPARSTLTGDWATSKGLRIGDPLSRVLAVYPKAASVRKLYPGVSFPAGRWQLEYKVFFGDRSPLLMAVMRSGKVVAFEASLGRGGE